MSTRISMGAGALIACVMFLSGCGGSGGRGAAPPPTPPVQRPTAATLNVNYGIKQLRFSWAAVEGATHYRLLQNPDGSSGFTQVGSDLPGTSATIDLAVHRHNWASARYALEACNSAGCTPSNEVGTVGAVLQAIGYFKASNPGQDDDFGFSVAVSGDGSTLAVGARGEASSSSGIGGTVDELAPDAGAVYVFTRGGTEWTQQAYIKPSNTGMFDEFGTSIALSGDGNTLVVGAPYEDGGGVAINSSPDEAALDAGAVYVFARSGAIWSQQAYVKASNAQTQDYFGQSVTLSADGNTLVACAPGEDSSTSGVDGLPNEGLAESGAAYVFTRSGTTWTQRSFLKASNPGSGDAYGWTATLSGDGATLAIGAYAEDSSSTAINSVPDEAGANSGAVYVYVRDASTWVQQAYIKAGNADAQDFFGGVIDLSGDGNTLAVGAPSESSSTTGVNSTPNESAIGAGAAYVFLRNNGVWTQQAYVKASNTEADDGFGISVALQADGSFLAVGALEESSASTGINSVPDESALNAGALYTFTRANAIWTQQSYVKAKHQASAGSGQRFGRSVAVSDSGATLAVGAVGESSGTSGVNSTPNTAARNAGAVFLY